MIYMIQNIFLNSGLVEALGSRSVWLEAGEANDQLDLSKLRVGLGLGLFSLMSAPAWTPKVCKIMAFSAILGGFGLFFTYFGGPGRASNSP